MRTIELVGEKFNRLTVVAKSSRKSNAGALWVCACDCGGLTVVASLKLRDGRTKSCGCYRDAKIAAVNRVHGLSNKSSTYKTWKEMRQRCLNPRNDKWRWYGGKGITVCDRWGSYENFLADMGPRPKGKTIDRIDNAKGYEPTNCQWLDQVSQTRKQVKNKLRDGVAELVRADRRAGMTYRALGEKYGVHPDTARNCCVYKTWA